MMAKADDEIERLAMEELLLEAKRGAERAKDLGVAGWVKPIVPPTNKRFLRNTLASTLRKPLKGTKHRIHSSSSDYSSDSDDSQRFRSKVPRHSKHSDPDSSGPLEDQDESKRGLKEDSSKQESSQMVYVDGVWKEKLKKKKKKKRKNKHKSRDIDPPDDVKSTDIVGDKSSSNPAESSLDLTKEQLEASDITSSHGDVDNKETSSTTTDDKAIIHSNSLENKISSSQPAPAVKDINRKPAAPPRKSPSCILTLPNSTLESSGESEPEKQAVSQQPADVPCQEEPHKQSKKHKKHKSKHKKHRHKKNKS